MFQRVFQMLQAFSLSRLIKKKVMKLVIEALKC